jgi:hypothetical protein
VRKFFCLLALCAVAAATAGAQGRYGDLWAGGGYGHLAGAFNWWNQCPTPGVAGLPAGANMPPNNACATGSDASDPASTGFAMVGDEGTIGTPTSPTNFSLQVTVALQTGTNVRDWPAVISDQSPQTLAVSDTPAGNTAGFRFSTVAGDTNFQAVLCSGGACHVIDCGSQHPVIVNVTMRTFEIALNDVTQTATFSIDGQVVATSSIDYPQSTALQFLGTVLDNTTATSASFAWASMHASTLQ